MIGKLVTIMFNIYYTTESLPYLTGFYIGTSFYEFVWDKTNYNPSYNNNIKNKVSYDLDKYIEAFLNTFKTKVEDINLERNVSEDEVTYIKSKLGDDFCNHVIDYLKKENIYE